MINDIKIKYNTLKLNKINNNIPIVEKCDDINNLDQLFIDNYNNKKKMEYLFLLLVKHLL